MPEHTPHPHPHHDRDKAVDEPAFGRLSVIALSVLAICFILCAVFSWTTRDAMENLPFLHHHATIDTQKTIVDLQPWQTAQSLEPLAVTTEEIEHARDAEHLADHEVDQAFATALRVALTQRPTLTPDALELQQRIVELQQAVKSDKQAVRQLTPAATPAAKPDAPHAAESKPEEQEDTEDTDSDDLALAKAQLGLDTDQLTETQQDFARATGDQRDRIQQELTAHEAAVQQYDARVRDTGQVAVLSAKNFSTLAGRLTAWHAQRVRYTLILQATAQAQQDENTLNAERSALQKETISTQPEATDTVSRLAALKARSIRHQLLSIYLDRIQTQQQLAAVYQKWSSQVQLQHRILLHLILQSLALIVVILICVLVGSGLIRRFFSRPTLDPRSAQTLRVILQLAVQFVGALCILIVVFGVPSQITTILGFATAGLTVALQQFILAFIGWFILMGRNGIRVGDVVEINHVAGEVLEINLFRTTLLETGNWTDKGHPTGRRVTFVNNFAISGEYFNFSTNGQWMWDEIKVNVPVSDDSYQLIERIHQTVLKETEEEAGLAEREWKTDGHRHGLNQYSACPTVNLRPAGSGTDIIIRYIVRAPERIEIRNRIYQAVLQVLHAPGTKPETKA